MKSYTTQPGTVPHRVIEHLKAQPPGTELSTAELAEAVGQPAGSMNGFLSSPRNHGALHAEKKHGLLFWSLGDGAPLAPPADREPDEPLRPVPKTPKKTASLFDVRQPRDIKPSKAAAPVIEPGIPIPIVRIVPAVPQPAPTPAADRAKFGAYSDGTFCIQRGTDTIWLSASEAKELAEFVAKYNT
jgi:hypothetical protein